MATQVRRLPLAFNAAGVLACHCFCHLLRTRDQVVLVGRPTNIAAARTLYMAIANLDTVRTQHQAAINSISRAASAVNDVNDLVLRGLRQLDELMEV